MLSCKDSRILNYVFNNDSSLKIIIKRGLLIIRWVVLYGSERECPWVGHHTYKPYSSPSCQGQPFLHSYQLLWKGFQFYFSLSLSLSFPRNNSVFFFFLSQQCLGNDGKLFHIKKCCHLIDPVSTSFLQQNFNFI